MVTVSVCTREINIDQIWFEQNEILRNLIQTLWYKNEFILTSFPIFVDNEDLESLTSSKTLNFKTKFREH